MQKVLSYFTEQLINSASSFGLNFTPCELKHRDLEAESLRIFEIPYYGHATGYFRLAIDHDAFKKYILAFNQKNEVAKATSLFNELLNQAISSVINQYDDFEHCTIGLPRSYNTPLNEPNVHVLEESVYDENCDSHFNLYLHHDARKTDLSIVFEEQQKEKEEISMIAQKLEDEKLSLNAQKFEAIGQLAAGVAHEINTPIQFVSDNINFLSESFKKLVNNLDNLKNIDIDFYIEEIPSALDESKEGLSRISSIIKSLKEFSHPGNDQIQLYPIKQLVTNCIALTKNEFKYVADVECEIEDLKARIFPNKLSQVLVNMIVNSSHSIRGKYNGKKQGLISVRFYQKNNDFVFELEDNGGGIDQKIVSKVFDPFFTTKAIGEGTGQGLAISKRIIEEKHNGEIEIVKNSPEGLCFKITIREPENE